MTLFAWIVLGLIAGFVARALLPGREPGGCFATILTGIVGALVGGWLSTFLDYGGLGARLDWRNLIIATLGSVVLLLIVRLLAGRRA